MQINVVSKHIIFLLSKLNAKLKHIFAINHYYYARRKRFHFRNVFLTRDRIVCSNKKLYHEIIYTAAPPHIHHQKKFTFAFVNL